MHIPHLTIAIIDEGGVEIAVAHLDDLDVTYNVDRGKVHSFIPAVPSAKRRSGGLGSKRG